MPEQNSGERETAVAGKGLKKLLQAMRFHRRVRNIIAGISIVLIIWWGIIIPFVLFAFAGVWLLAGVPTLYAIWWDQPALHFRLIVFFLGLGAMALAIGFAGAIFWIRFLQAENLVSERDVWPFGKGQWSTAWDLPNDAQTLEHLRSTRRMRATFGFIWLSFWALLGAAIAPVIMIPLALWLMGGVSLFNSISQAFSIPSNAKVYWAVMISLFFGFITGTPVAVFWCRRFLKGALGLTDDEVNALLTSRSKTWIWKSLRRRQ